MASKDTPLKWLLPSVKPTLVMFIICMPALCSTSNLTCSEPNQPALLHALTPVFNLSAIRPVQNITTCTKISMFFTLYGILGVDEKSQLLMTYIWLHYWWENEFARWDPAQCGSSKISLPRSKMWLPDIVINEFMDENSAPPVPYVYLHSDGLIHDAHPVRIVSSCNLDIYTFPFDIQNCSLTFNSYIHYIRDIKIILGISAEVITGRSKDVMTTMGEWELLDITSPNKTYTEDGYYVDTLVFHIRVKRRATLYVVNLLLPSCFLITVDLFSFLLPPQSVDRSSFKMTLILGYTVFLLIMNDLLPITGNTIPLINVFFSLCLALMVASLLETVLITNLLCGSADFSPVPHWIRVFVLQILGFLVCMPQKTKEPRDSEIGLKTSTVAAKSKTDDGSPEVKRMAVQDKALQELRSLSKDLQAIRVQVEQQVKGSKSSEEWKQVGFIIDRLLFVLYILFVSVSFIAIIIIWASSFAPCSSTQLRCPQPDTLSLLAALEPVFKLSPIRPVMNLSTVTNITLDMTMVGILGVDEKAQVLTTYIWQYLIWQNEFVSWDPEECGSYWITLPRKRLWVPDIVINEFMGKNTAPFVPYTYLSYDGTVLDEKPIRVVSSCRLDIFTFPFDIQNCTFSFNSYLYLGTDVNLEITWTGEDMFQISQHTITTMGEWELVGITAQKFERKTYANEDYDEIRFYIALRRRATLYVVNLLVPTCFLITVDLFSFMLPPRSVDRSLFKMTLVLGYTVFLLSMNDLLPITGNTIPLINVFLSLCLALMVASLLESILITNLLCGSAHYSPVPHWLRVLVLHILGPLVRLPPKPRDGEDTVIQNPATQVEIEVYSIMEDDSKTPEQTVLLNDDMTLQELRSMGRDLQAIRLQVEQQLSRNQNTEEWIQVGFIIDRLLFILYILFISLSFICIIIMWVNWYQTHFNF